MAKIASHPQLARDPHIQKFITDISEFFTHKEIRFWQEAINNERFRDATITSLVDFLHQLADYSTEEAKRTLTQFLQRYDDLSSSSQYSDLTALVRDACSDPEKAYKESLEALEKAIRKQDSVAIKVAIDDAHKVVDNPKELLRELIKKLEKKKSDAGACAFAKKVLAKFDALKKSQSATHISYLLDPETVYKKSLQALEDAIRKQDSGALSRAIDDACDIVDNPRKMLEDLIKKLETTNSSDAICALAKDALAKFDALQKIKGELHLSELLPYHMLKICAVGEVELQRRGSDARHIKKSKFDVTHSLLIDPKKRTMTVLLKKKGIVNAQGGMGKVQSSIELGKQILENQSSTTTAEHVVQKVNRDTSKMCPEELEYEQRYGDLRTVAVYTKVKEGEEIQKTTFTMKKMDCDLRTAIKQGQLTDSQKWKILKDIAATIAKMHADEVIHHDIKLANCMCNLTTAEGRLIDFGVAYEKQTSRTYYGTPEYTSPEVVDNPKKPYTTKERCAQDMYAFGCAVYELFYGERTPWHDDLGGGIREDNQILREKAHASQQAIREKLEPLREQRKAGQPLTDDDEQTYLIYSLLDPDPETRMNIAEFQAYVSKKLRIL